nr:hypothetical protein Iba_chr03bCG2650 [Ipomoea batatas]
MRLAEDVGIGFTCCKRRTTNGTKLKFVTATPPHCDAGEDGRSAIAAELDCCRSATLTGDGHSGAGVGHGGEGNGGAGSCVRPGEQRSAVGATR